MKDFPDSVMIEMFKNLGIKSAIRLSETSKRHHSILNNPEYGLWEFYLNRDFPQVTQPLDRDFKTTYIKHHLMAAINKLDDIVIFILDPTKDFISLGEIRTLKTRISAITDQTTVHELITLQLELKTNISATYIFDFFLNTPLIWAAYRGDSEIVQALIQAGANVNSTNNGGQSPLMTAARWGHTSIVEILIQAGARIHATNKYGDTALILAAFNGHTESAQALIQAGANINAADKGGQTPLILARGRNFAQTVKLLEGVIHFKSTVKPMLISKAIEFQERKHRLERNRELEQDENPSQNTIPNVM